MVWSVKSFLLFSYEEEEPGIIEKLMLLPSPVLEYKNKDPLPKFKILQHTTVIVSATLHLQKLMTLPFWHVKKMVALPQIPGPLGFIVHIAHCIS
jgi:hypothetical protein